MKHLVKHRKILGFAGFCNFIFSWCLWELPKSFEISCCNSVQFSGNVCIFSCAFNCVSCVFGTFGGLLCFSGKKPWHPLVPTGLAGRLGHGPASYFDLFWWVIAPEQLRNMSAWPISWPSSCLLVGVIGFSCGLSLNTCSKVPRLKNFIKRRQFWGSGLSSDFSHTVMNPERWLHRSAV